MPSVPSPVVIIRPLITTAAGAGFTNVYYYTPTAMPSNGTDMNQIANDFNVVFAPLYKGILNNLSTYMGCAAEFKNGATLLQGSATNLTGAGALVNGPVGDEVCICFRKGTGLGGRQNRGRMFVSGLDVDVFSAGNPDEIEVIAYLPAAQSLAAQLASDQTLNGVIHHSRLWDRKDNALKPITEGHVSSRLASRRDRRRHAPNIAK